MDNKMVKELADTLEYLCFSDTTYDEDDELIPNYKGIAEELIKHYQPKLPKDSVVLSKEDLQNLSNLEIGDWASTASIRKIADAVEKQVRKETAEKIREIAKQKSFPTWLNVDDNPRKERLVLLSDIDELAKQFGVEIKE